MAKGKGKADEDDAGAKGKKGKGKDGKAKDGKAKDGKAKPRRAKGGIRPLRLGILVAAALAGPPLYRLVQQGSLDPTTAFSKAGIVALGVAIGVSWIRGLVIDYQAEIELDKRRKAARAQELLRMIELEAAAKAAEAAAEAAAAKAKARRGSGSGSGSGAASGPAPGVTAPGAAASAPVPHPVAAIPTQPGVPQPTQPA